MCEGPSHLEPHKGNCGYLRHTGPRPKILVLAWYGCVGSLNFFMIELDNAYQIQIFERTRHSTNDFWEDIKRWTNVSDTSLH